MDSRRHLSLAALALVLGATPTGAGPAPAAPPPGAMAPIPNPQPAIRPDQRLGGLRVLAYAPGRVFEVRTAPLRVTCLTLGPEETVTALAAGDTVRWQIAETASGEGAGRRAHVLVKPLSRGLVTNLVLATSRRTYLLRLSSGPAAQFDPAVAWTADALDPEPPAPPPPTPPPAAEATPVFGAPLDAAYRIIVRGRRPAWTPTAVLTDGRRTLIAAPEAAGETPGLFAITPQGEAQMVNYRQQGGLFIVDRVLDRAELRLGDRRPQVVELRREAARP